MNAHSAEKDAGRVLRHKPEFTTDPADTYDIPPLPDAESDAALYRVEFSIQRRLPGEEDFTEVGFGSSGEWSSLDTADHMASSAISSREWETTAGMPDPSEVDHA